MSDDTFHPELAASARGLPRGLGRSWSLPLMRGALRLGAVFDRPSETVDIGGLTLFLYHPAVRPEAPSPAALWLHGGGLIMGDARQESKLLRSYAEALGITFCAVQYRLAPEHPFPAGLDDAHRALQWLAARPDVDASKIVVGGLSAGGGLSAALAQRCRGEEVAPCHQVLVYPMLDHRTGADPHPKDDSFRLWDRASNRNGWSSYLRTHDPDEPPPFASAARTEDLSGLPPAWIGVGTLDLFHDEDVAYARRLEAAGVETTLEVVPGAYHGFEITAWKTEVARAFRDAQVASIRARLAELGWTRS